jgi:hypothetical protein
VCLDRSGESDNIKSEQAKALYGPRTLYALVELGAVNSPGSAARAMSNAISTYEGPKCW